MIKCDQCPFLQSLMMSNTAELEAAAKYITEGVMDDTVTVEAVIRLERGNGTEFYHEGLIDGPAAAGILDAMDDQKSIIKEEVSRDLSCGKGPLTLRAAGVEIAICRRLTDQLPEAERITVDPDLLIPVFIRPALSRPPETA